MVFERVHSNALIELRDFAKEETEQNEATGPWNVGVLTFIDSLRRRKGLSGGISHFVNFLNHLLGAIIEIGFASKDGVTAYLVTEEPNVTRETDIAGHRLRCPASEGGWLTSQVTSRSQAIPRFHEYCVSV